MPMPVCPSREVSRPCIWGFPPPAAAARFHVFSGTCLYFGLHYMRLRPSGPAGPPIGLIQSAVGGTHIEAWLDNETLPLCRNISDPGIAHNLFYGMIAPFVNMTVSGWVWYQVIIQFVRPEPAPRTERGWR